MSADKRALLKQRLANQKSRNAAETDWTIAERQCDPSPNPEEQASYTQRQKRLLAVFKALGEDDRLCLQLRAEGLRYREIAEVLGMSLGSVAQSLGRSLGKLSSVEARLR